MAAAADPIIMSAIPEDQLEAIWTRIESQITPFAQVIQLDFNLFGSLDAGAQLFIVRKAMVHWPERLMYCIDGLSANRIFLGAARSFVDDKGMIIRPVGSLPVYVPRPQLPALVVQQFAAAQAAAAVQAAADQAIVAAGGAAPAFPQQAGLAPGATATPAQHAAVGASQANTTAARAAIRIPRPPNAYILYRKERHHMVKQANPSITNNEISQVLGRAWNLESREVRFKYKDMAEAIKRALLAKYPDYQYKPRKPSEKRRRARRATQQSAADVPVDADASSPGNIVEVV
ncbi:Fc.00g036570.m01.CDS01 [Cosmosporella sp. VM-42]